MRDDIRKIVDDARQGKPAAISVLDAIHKLAENGDVVAKGVLETTKQYIEETTGAYTPPRDSMLNVEHQNLLSKLGALNDLLPNAVKLTDAELLKIGFAFGVVEAIEHEHQKKSRTLVEEGLQLNSNR